jgi:phosphoribosyl 1,2-cyclic phosphate phosphodiesterase
MIVTILGSGTSSGVPLIGCSCEVCRSLDFRDKRLRASVHIAAANKSFVIDTGPDFRQQVLREALPSLDAVIYTHAHKDHTAGLDDVRGFNFLQKRPMPLYATDEVLEQIKMEFSYAFAFHKYPGIPQLELHQIENKNFEVEGVCFQPIQVKHHKLDVFGYRLGDFAYVTDVNGIETAEMTKLENLDVLILGALQKTPHISHYTLAEALAVIEFLKPKRAYLTHMSHSMGRHAMVEKELPTNVKLCYDGLKLVID